MNSQSAADPGKAKTHQRLESWKAIARYLNRTVRTVQRWEKSEGLPVRRHLHQKHSSVYANASEIDAWLTQRTERSRRISFSARRLVLPTSAASAVFVLLYAWFALLPESMDVGGQSYVPDAEAHHYYEIGREHLRRRNHTEAIAAFNNAISRDPAYAKPYGGLAIVRAVQAGRVMDRVSYADARAVAQRALDIEPELPEALTALGIVALEREGAVPAETLLRKALELDPHLIDARYWLTLSLQEQGRHAEADAQLDRAIRTDPLHPLINEEQGQRYWGRGDYEGALRSYQRMLESPDPPWESMHNLVMLNQAFGRFEDALYWAKELARKRPIFSGFNALIGTYTRLEMHSEAERWLEILTLAEGEAPPRLGIRCTHLYMKGMLEECYRLKEAYLERTSTSLSELPFAVRETHGGMAVLTGRHEEGIGVLEPLYGYPFRVPAHLGGSITALTFGQFLAYAYQQTDRDADAASVIAEIQEHVEALRRAAVGQRPALYIVEAKNLALLEDTEGALRSLRLAVEGGWRDYVYERPNPIWEPLRATPEYQSLMDRVVSDVAMQRQRINAAGSDIELQESVLQAIVQQSRSEML